MGREVAAVTMGGGVGGGRVGSGGSGGGTTTARAVALRVLLVGREGMAGGGGVGVTAVWPRALAERSSEVDELSLLADSAAWRKIESRLVGRDNLAWWWS